MWILLIYLFISLIVPLVIGIGRFLIRSKFIRTDSFECGFDSFNVSVFPVSLRFFYFLYYFFNFRFRVNYYINYSFSLMNKWIYYQYYYFFIFSYFENINRVIIW